jgi:hypothetical protein
MRDLDGLISTSNLCCGALPGITVRVMLIGRSFSTCLREKTSGSGN